MYTLPGVGDACELSTMNDASWYVTFLSKSISKARDVLFPSDIIERLEVLFANVETCVAEPVEGEIKRTEANKIETKRRDFRRVWASSMVSPAIYADYLYFKSITLRLQS